MEDTSQEHGYTPAKQAYVRRLKLIEGQVRGLARMVEGDEYCIDILTQVSAATSALRSLSLCLLKDHLEHCVAHAAAEGGDVADEKFEEVIEAVRRLVK